jgi:serine/threonine protein phosphatase 1
MSRTLAIGDIHGCTIQLEALLEAVHPTDDDTVIFLGDYVDRGPDSKGAVERVRNWVKNRGAIALRGNHEIMMLEAKDDKAMLRMWMNVGGAECLASYSSRSGRIGKFSEISDDHWSFLKNDLLPYYETPTAIFVHAGLDASKPLTEQPDDALYWSPLDKDISWPDGRMVIVGHTSQKSGQILKLGQTICIDTCAYHGGPLTCLDVGSMTAWHADLLGRVTIRSLKESS